MIQSYLLMYTTYIYICIIFEYIEICAKSMVQHYDTSISLQGWFKIVTELLEDPIRYLMNNKTIAVEGHAQKTKTITEGFASQHG